MTTMTPADGLEQLSDTFFQIQNTSNPFNATLLGITGYDALLPDVTRDGARTDAARLRAVETVLMAIDPSTLDDAGQVNHAVLSRLTWGARSDLEHGLWETNFSAQGYVAPQAHAFLSVPSAIIADDHDASSYLVRLRGLGHYFDSIGDRLLAATKEGRTSTRAGVQQAIDQLAGYLALPIDEDVFGGTAALGTRVDLPAFRRDARTVAEQAIRPSMERLLDTLRGHLLPGARDDAHVGIRFVPGGTDGYRDAVRRHTTTDLSPEEIHDIGLECIASLHREWAVLGTRVLGTSDVPSVLSRLREDRTLRFTTSAEILGMVTAALTRAESVRNQWFPAYEIPDCVVEEINPIEAGSAALAYYRAPATGGVRSGAHCVLTTNPHERFTYEYEALAFHESTPGHHLQIASAQTLVDLPVYRRFLDDQVCGYVEGWGLYSERLADEMGLYSSDVARLGMLSFDALRASRLVVDTGMHHFGWTRRQAADYMWANTATTLENVTNEIDRYIGWPGQALSYMIGRREIQRLRASAESRLGQDFDVRAFHETVLGNGAVPLDVLNLVVTRWIDSHPASPSNT